MWKSRSEILETPRTSGSKNETPCEKTPSTAQDISQAPKDRKTKGQYLKKKKKRHFQTRRAYHPKSLAKRAIKGCAKETVQFFSEKETETRKDFL